MQQPRSKRIKRDSAGNLYRHCKQGGDCIDDVVRKFENKTPADKILQWGSTAVYFGGAGIGTGRGTGGATGYRPIGGELPTGGRPVVPRPAIPIDPLGAVDVGGLGVDGTVTSEAPSIVPLLESDTTVTTDTGGPNVIVHEVQIHPPPGTPSVTTVSSSAAEAGESVAVLEVGGSSVGGTHDILQTVESTSHHSNPSFTTVVHSTPTVGEASVSRSVVVSHDLGGTVVDHNTTFEEIPLQSFGSSEFDIAEPVQRSSTPLETIAKKARQLYHRTVRQNPVENTQFLTRPSSLVQFENPAFDPDPDVTLTFDTDPDLPRAAPDPDFRDVKRLGRVQYGQAPGGRVRVSRLGTTATMKLRSGTHTGGRAHYFHDISSIADEPPGIELSTFGEHSGEQVIILDSSNSAIIDETNFEGTLSFPEEEQLLDEYEEDFSHGQLVMASGRGRTRIVNIPAARQSVKAYVTVTDLGDAVVVAHPDGIDISTSHTPFTPLSPSVYSPPSVDLSVTFDLHPSLLRRKRKRKAYYI